MSLTPPPPLWQPDGSRHPGWLYPIDRRLVEPCTFGPWLVDRIFVDADEPYLRTCGPYSAAVYVPLEYLAGISIVLDAPGEAERDRWLALFARWGRTFAAPELRLVLPDGAIDTPTLDTRSAPALAAARLVGGSIDSSFMLCRYFYRGGIQP